MYGSLCLHRGTLFVGRHEKTAHVRPFDLDGRPLGDGFRFRDPLAGRSTASGLSVDDDRQIWVADEPAHRLRGFSLFGAEVRGLGGAVKLARRPRPDSPGSLERPVDVVALGDGEELLLWVACGGTRRHAVQAFDGGGHLVCSLRPAGDPDGSFGGVRGIAAAGRFVWVAEAARGRVQVFRGGDFHFAFRPSGPGHFEPTAVAPLEDGRVLVAHAGEHSGLTLFDAAGRRVREVAGHGPGEGAVFDPSDVVVEPGASERRTRIAVIDRDGDRIQVFSLEGTCFGTFGELPVRGESASGEGAARP